MSRRLYLVRHGQTTWNVLGRLQGQSPGGELTELGWEQSKKAAEALAGCGAKYLICSDSRRTKQTALPIADKLGLVAEYEPLLREQCFGDMEGRLRSELNAEETPPGWHIYDVRWGDGESVADVYTRWQQFVTKIARKAPGDAVIVSHGVMIRVAQGWAQGKKPQDVEWVECANGSVTILDV